MKTAICEICRNEKKLSDVVTFNLKTAVATLGEKMVCIDHFTPAITKQIAFDYPTISSRVGAIMDNLQYLNTEDKTRVIIRSLKSKVWKRA